MSTGAITARGTVEQELNMKTPPAYKTATSSVVIPRVVIRKNCNWGISA
jgi:hypothetical protein